MDGSRVEQAVIADLKNVVKTLSEALSQVESMLKEKKCYIENMTKDRIKEITKETLKITRPLDLWNIEFHVK